MRATLFTAGVALLGCDPGRGPGATSVELPPARDAAARDATGADHPPATDVLAPQDVLLVEDSPAPTVDAPPARVGTLAREGDAVTLRTHPTVNYRFVDAAYDPARRVFLVVYGNAPVGGAFLDDEGAQVGDGFRLTEQPQSDGLWTQFPRVAAGRAGFVVTWHAEFGRSPVVQSRRVIPGPSFGPTVSLSDPGTQQESPAALSYAPDRDEFLVVWAHAGLKGRRLSGEGAARGEIVALSTPGVWVEQPAVAWHPGAGAYFVTYMQEVSGTAQVMLLRVSADGAPAGEARSLSGPLSFAKVTDLELDARTGELVASWYAVQGGVRGFAAQRVRADGTLVDTPRTVFAPHGSYDGYDLAWSAATGTLLAVFHGAGAEVAGAELDGAWRETPAGDLTSVMPRNGVFLPRVVAHPARPWWIALGSPDYARVIAQRIARRP